MKRGPPMREYWKRRPSPPSHRARAAASSAELGGPISPGPASWVSGGGSPASEDTAPAGPSPAQPTSTRAAVQASHANAAQGRVEADGPQLMVSARIEE